MEITKFKLKQKHLDFSNEIDYLPQKEFQDEGSGSLKRGISQTLSKIQEEKEECSDDSLLEKPSFKFSLKNDKELDTFLFEKKYHDGGLIDFDSEDDYMISKNS